MTYRDNFSKQPIAPETGSLAYTRTRLALRVNKLTQTTLLVCLSRGAPCISQAIGPLRGHPSILYIWLNSLTFNPVTILKTIQIKRKKQKFIYTNTNNLTSRKAKSI